MTIATAREIGRFCLALITTLMVWSVAMEMRTGRGSCSTGSSTSRTIAGGERVAGGTMER